MTEENKAAWNGFTKEQQRIDDVIQIYNHVSQALADLDDGVLELPIETVRSLFGDLKGSIDSFAKFDQAGDLRLAMINSQIDTWTRAKKLTENAQKAGRDFLKHHMEEHGLKKLDGEEHTVSYQARSSMVPTFEDLSIDNFIEFNQLKSGLVKTEYKWDKKLFKKYCDENKEFAEKNAETKTSTFLVYRPNNKLKKTGI